MSGPRRMTGTPPSERGVLSRSGQLVVEGDCSWTRLLRDRDRGAVAGGPSAPWVDASTSRCDAASDASGVEPCLTGKGSRWSVGLDPDPGEGGSGACQPGPLFAARAVMA